MTFEQFVLENQPRNYPNPASVVREADVQLR
jgi:hypothetical protein